MGGVLGKEEEMKPKLVFTVRPYHDKWGVYSYPSSGGRGQYDLVFSTEERAWAAREILEFWYWKGIEEGLAEA